MTGESTTDADLADADDATGPEAEMRAAIAEIRREGTKAALLYALVDGVLVTLAATLLVALSGVDALSAAGSPVAAPTGAESIPLGAILAVAAGLAAFAAEFAYRTRQPIVERFEAANPPVHEALRTARDAVEDGAETPMARTLYADVVDRLEETSALALLSVRRLGIALVLVLALSVGTVQVTVSGIEVTGAEGGQGGPSGDAPAPVEGATPTPGGLRAGDDVLGAAETVTPGSENLSAEISYDEGGGGDGDDRDYETGGLSDGTAVEAERAGYAPRGDLEDAALIREYNVRIRGNASDRPRLGDSTNPISGDSMSETTTDPKNRATIDREDDP